MVVSFVEWWVPQIRTRTRVAATTPEWSLRRAQQEIWRPISSTALLVINLCWGWHEMRDTGGLRAKFAGDPALTLTPPGHSARIIINSILSASSWSYCDNRFPLNVSTDEIEILSLLWLQQIKKYVSDNRWDNNSIIVSYWGKMKMIMTRPCQTLE